VDDAFIAYRHARNLARGHGAVPNPGEAVEGVSNLPWTALLGGAAAVGVPAHVAGPWLSALVALVAVLTTARVARGAGTRAAPAAWAAALFAPLGIWGASGMETAAEAALVALALGAALAAWRTPRRAPWAALAFAALAALRPEGAALGAAAVIALIVATREIGPAVLWTGAGTFAGWVGMVCVRLAVYDDWMPNPVWAKSPAGVAALSAGVLYVAKLAVSYPLAFAAVALARRRLTPLVHALVCAIVGIQIVFALAVGGDHFAGYRFLLPVWPALALALAACATADAWLALARAPVWIALGVVGAIAAAAPHALVPLAAPVASLARLQEPLATHSDRLAAEVRHIGTVVLCAAAYLAWVGRAGRRSGPRAVPRAVPHAVAPASPSALRAAPVALVAALALPQSWDPQIRSCRKPDGASEFGRVSGEWLHGAMPPGTLIATNAAGALPYFADLPAIDMLGLTDRHIARTTPDAQGWIGHERGDGRYVLDRRPCILVLGGAEGSVEPGPFAGDRQIVADPRFAAEYLVQRVGVGTERRFDFTFYRRRDCAVGAR
jgi:hypothetical protein